MENYTKGEVKEVDEAPVFSLAPNDVNMRVAAGSKIRNLMGFAMKKIKEPETKQLCWSGSGKAITKTVSCAEIMKRKIKGLHQVTKIQTRRVEEYWEPKLEGLERLKVNRDIPTISILLSKDPLDQSQPGYQTPGSFDEFWTKMVQKEKEKQVPKNARKRKFQNENSQKQKKFGEKNTNRQKESVKGDKKNGNNGSNSPHSNNVKDDTKTSSAKNT